MSVGALVVGRKRRREPLFPELKELLFCSSCSVIEGSFSGLVMALRLRSLQCLPSLSCSGLFSRPAPQLRGDSHQTLTGS